MKRSEIFFGLIRIPVDFGLALTAFFAAYHIRALPDLFFFLKKPDLETFPPLGDYMHSAFYGAFLMLIIFALFKLYTLKSTALYGREVQNIVVAVTVWLMAVITYYFLIRDFPFSRLILFYSWFFGMIFMVVGRGLVRLFQKIFLFYGVGRRKVVLLGEGKISAFLKDILVRGGMYEVVNTVISLESLKSAIDEQNIDEVFQTKNIVLSSQKSIVDFCRERHVEYHFVPEVLEVFSDNIEVRMISGMPIISLKKTPLDGWGKVLKRTFDIFVSAVMLVILTPIFVIISIAIRMDSRGNIFFHRDDQGKVIWRVGQNGKKFRCWKFRTMKTNTHGLRYSAEFQGKNFRKDSPLVKINKDPRVTQVGRFLRKYSLDELPQLWNVLIGDMSLCGPRPHLEEEVGGYEGRHKFVHAIKPGITGLSQVSGRSDLPFEEEIRLDTFYIEHWSLLLDMKILLKTVTVVLRGYKE